MEKLTESEMAELDLAMKAAQRAPTAKAQIKLMRRWLNFDKNRLSQKQLQHYNQVVNLIIHKAISQE